MYRKFGMRPIVILTFCFFLAVFGCKKSTEEKLTLDIDVHSSKDLKYPEKDIKLPDSLQNQFTENFFVPWKSPSDELLSSLDAFPGKELTYLQKYLDDDEWYGENKKPHTKSQREDIVNNVNPETFPNFLKRGITISHTDLRRVPTQKPGFDTYSKAGEGYPFDYFQETIVWANTPVFMVHISEDKQWCYVICPYYKGWISMHDMAIVDEDFITKWSSGDFCLPLSDKVNLQNTASQYAINAKMGMLLPYEETSSDTDKVWVYYANADENQNAKILKAEVDKNTLAFGDFSFNEENLKDLVSNLTGKPYGWGGKLENRDCSAMIRDLLGTFRIWLPRDSKDQMELGQYYEFPESTEEKINLIKEKGIPFLTILRKKGHNMLYVGDAPNGDPLILHAIWGLKTSYSSEKLANFLSTYPVEGIHQDQDGSFKGRHIIGESVITSVRIGDTNTGITIPLIDEMYAMTNLLDKQ